jgi:hypothetical protein
LRTSQQENAMTAAINTSGAHRYRRAHRRAMLSCGGALSVLSLALAAAPSAADGAHSVMLVSAQVLPVARLQIASGASPLQISAADIAAGYVDAPRPLELRIDSNSREGFAVDVSALSPWCAAVALQGFDSPVMLDGTEGTIIQRWGAGRMRSLALRARFTLAAGVRPGSYPWPLRLSARPL